MTSVYNWLNLYNIDSVPGLHTKAGQGRKPILKKVHLSVVRAAVEQKRQPLSQAPQIIEKTNQFSYQIKKYTVIVLDNAKMHQSKVLKAMQNVWVKRQFFVCYLPSYSPHLTIIKRLWKEIKVRWIQTKYYETDEKLCYATMLILNPIGKNLFINFKKQLLDNFDRVLSVHF